MSAVCRVLLFVGGFYFGIASGNAATKELAADTPTYNPTAIPTVATGVPTNSPITAAPTNVPRTDPKYELFAILNNTSCAEDLPFGPSQISLEGSTDGHLTYFSTNTTNKDVVHDEWYQVMTLPDVYGKNYKYMTITWKFDTPRTLAGHLTAAVNEGVTVKYSSFSVLNNTYPSVQSTWRFSSTAGNMTTKFATKTTQFGFSDAFGVWGGANVTVDGANNKKVNSSSGLGNWRAYSNISDKQEACRVSIASEPALWSEFVKVEMYFSTQYPAVPSTTPTLAPTATQTVSSAQPTAPPSGTVSVQPTEASTIVPTAVSTVAPTLSPSAPIRFVSLQATQVVEGVSFAAYSANEEGFNSVFITTIAASAATSTNSVTSLVVTAPATATLSVHALRTVTTVLRAEKNLNSDALRLQYNIQVPGTNGMSYTQLSTTLTNSVQNGQFTSSLQQYATEQAVPELASAYSSTVQTRDTSTGSSSRGTPGENLSGSAVAGIVLCTLAGAMFFAFTIYRLREQRPVGRTNFQVVNNQPEKGLFSTTSDVDNPLHQQDEL